MYDRHRCGKIYPSAFKLSIDLHKQVSLLHITGPLAILKLYNFIARQLDKLLLGPWLRSAARSTNIKTIGRPLTYETCQRATTMREMFTS